MIHAKTMLIDDRLVVIGSMNLDFLSMDWLEEGSLVVDDRAFAAEFEKRWRIDLARSRPMTGHRLAADAGLEGRRGPEPATAGA
jgi:cardiolipin synthase